jgi:hypothetical protein
LHALERSKKQTASFKTDSPNTKAYKLTSEPSSWNIDRTVTGSVADIRAPNIRHSTSGSLYIRNVSPPRYLQYNKEWTQET